MNLNTTDKKTDHTHIVALATLGSIGLLVGGYYQVTLIFVFSIFLYLLPVIFWAYSGWKDKLFVRKRHGKTQVVRGKVAALLGAFLTFYLLFIAICLLAWVYIYLEKNGFQLPINLS